MRLLPSVLTAVLSAWVGPSILTAADSATVKQAHEILRKTCGRCHGADGTNEGGVNYVLDASELVAKKKIVPGAPAKSLLFKKIAAGEMPPEDERPRPSPAEIAVLERWIKEGAEGLNLGQATGRAFRTTEDALAAVLKHLKSLPAADRPSQRYLSLVHLYNNATISDAELRLHRAAVSKLVNSLSWRGVVILPEAIDAEGTLMAIDVRRLDWADDDLWHEILRRYPYALKHDLDANAAVRELATEIYQLADTEVPVVRGDWFLANASRPPLYHTLLKLPGNAAELERELKVDVAVNFEKNQLARAGFTASGVSGQNRLVERHDATYGAYWKSYDFKSNEGLGNLFRLPLGPPFPGNPFGNQAFEHDGGELIFNLPNGLQAYLLVNGKEERIDVGPIAVVSDSLKTSGTAEIVNGLSCMACHNHGMKSEFKDTVREGTALQGRPLEKVRRLYPLPAEMNRLLASDSQRFLTALDKAVAKFLKAGVDAGKDLREFPEPVGAAARQYVLRELTLADAAMELGLIDPERLKAAILYNPQLSAIGLRPLATGATIKRETWESRERAISPFQEAASALDLGSPKNVN